MKQLTHKDYKKILKFYKKKVPKTRKKIKKTANKILAKKFCSCIQKVQKKTKSKKYSPIGICTKSVIQGKGFKRGKFKCKKRRSIKLHKGGKRRRRTRKKKGGWGFNDEGYMVYYNNLTHGLRNLGFKQYYLIVVEEKNGITTVEPVTENNNNITLPPNPKINYVWLTWEKYEKYKLKANIINNNNGGELRSMMAGDFEGGHKRRTRKKKGKGLWTWFSSNNKKYQKLPTDNDEISEKTLFEQYKKQLIETAKKLEIPTEDFEKWTIQESPYTNNGKVNIKLMEQHVIEANEALECMSKPKKGGGKKRKSDDEGGVVESKQ